MSVDFGGDSSFGWIAPETFFWRNRRTPLTFRENISIITYMIKKGKSTAAYRRVASRLKKLLTDGQVIEGTLTRVTVGSAAHYQLTSKERGKTKTVYVPLCAKQEVEQWARRWKEAKALLKGLSDCSRSILASSVRRMSREHLIL